MHLLFSSVAEREWAYELNRVIEKIAHNLPGFRSGSMRGLSRSKLAATIGTISLCCVRAKLGCFRRRLRAVPLRRKRFGANTRSTRFFVQLPRPSFHCQPQSRFDTCHQHPGSMVVIGSMPSRIHRQRDTIVSHKKLAGITNYCLNALRSLLFDTKLAFESRNKAIPRSGILMFA